MLLKVFHKVRWASTTHAKLHSFIAGSVKFVLDMQRRFGETRVMPAHEYLTPDEQQMMIKTNLSGMRQKLLYIVPLQLS